MNNMTKGRGFLSERAKKKSKEFFGYEIDKQELRLISYVQYIMVNTQNVDIRHINPEEMAILRKWHDTGYITLSGSNISVSKNFWDMMCEILWVAYVDYNSEEEDE